MASAIEKITNLKCTSKSPIYVSPFIAKDEKKFEEYKEKQATKLVQDEFLNEDNLITTTKVFQEQEKPNIQDEWRERIRFNPALRNYYLQTFVEYGLTKEEADFTIKEANDRLNHAIEWSQENEQRGNLAAKCALATTILGVAKSICSNIDATPQLVNSALNILQGLSLGGRSYEQYTLYGREDDDKGLSVYQRDHYGNRITGDTGELSCAIETKLKPYVLPFLGFLSSDTRDCLDSLLTLPTTLFWRSKYPGLIHQKYLTTLLSYATHKPLACLGLKRSKTTLEQMEHDVNLVTFSFLKQRLRTLLQVKDDESVPGKIYKLSRGLFSSDINTVEKSALILNETFAPLLGIAGFFTSLIGVPLHGILTLGKAKDYLPPFMVKAVDSFSTLGQATQHLLYALRFSTTEYVQAKKTVEMLNKVKGGTEEQRQEFSRLANDRYNLAAAGLAANFLNILLPVTRLFGGENLPIKIIKSLTYEGANGVSQYFFSRRRELRGRKFRISNPKLFEVVS